MVALGGSVWGVVRHVSGQAALARGGDQSECRPTPSPTPTLTALEANPSWSLS